ncbi:DDE-type integrase/transposase/recombinase [Mycobacterium sp. MUNTM1]
MFTTITDPAASRPADLLNRQFKAPSPNRLWVADITFVRTWHGLCYTAFVTDACTKKIVGWAVSATMRTEDLPLQAFNHAVWQSDSTLFELTHHSDRGSQGGFNRWSQHLVIVEVLDGSSSAGSRSGDQAQAQVAGSSEVPASCRGGVLGADRQRAAA